MIRNRRVAASLALCVAMLAAPAHADVLEIGTDGYGWKAGGPVVAMPDGVFAAIDPVEVPGGLSIPGEAVADPALHAGGIPAAYAAKVQELSHRFDLSPALIEALVWQESRWNPRAVSPVGARGLAQLMPGTARYLGVDADDPFANLEGGARYLREQLDLFDGDVEKALAAYNAGPGRVLRAGGIPRIRETQGYVAAIMGRLSNHSRSSN